MWYPSSARSLRIAASGGAFFAAAALGAAPGLAAPPLPTAAAPAAAVPPLTREQEQQIGEIRKALPPAARALVRPAVTALSQKAAVAGAPPPGTAPSLADAEQAVRDQPDAKGLSDADANAVALLVLADAARDAEDERKDADAAVKKINTLQARLHILQAKAGSVPTAAATPRPAGLAAADPAPPRARPILLTASLSERDVTNATPERRSQMASDIQQDRNALDDLYAQESLRRQAASDRRAKLLALLSDLLKQAGAAQDGPPHRRK